MRSAGEQHDPVGGKAPGADGGRTDPRAHPPTGEVPLRQLLIAVGDPLVDVLAAPRGFDVGVSDVVIVDPDESGGVRAGDVVLAIGARGRAAAPMLREAGTAGAAAVAVKVDAEQDIRVLRAIARDLGVALLGVRADVRWDRLESFARSAVNNARLMSGVDEGESLGDLFSLAQTVAAMTNGIVTIEDTAHRVLAYSRTDDEVDELRRLSILGRRGPESYLVKLREWGVYERLRGSEDVVSVDERPELGIRRRRAVGIHAGPHPLGTIWVQEGAAPLADSTERALLGAARVAATQLVRQRTQIGAAPRFREDLLTGLLEGRLDAASVADNIGADPAKPAAVAAFAMRRSSGHGHAERSELELLRAEMIGLISVHASAYRRSALVTTVGSRVYVLLPELPRAESPVLGLVREIVAATRVHLGVGVQAGVGSPVETLDSVAESRAEADRVLGALRQDVSADAATISEVRAQVLVGEALGVLGEGERFRDPRVLRLLRHDRQQGGELAGSLLAYLEAFGDVRAASERMHVHPNTLRYRVRKAAGITEIDLSDPTERLNAQLQLLLARQRP